MLYIISTPIGNLKDITLRAIETLREVDGIICEDSRRTAILLNHYQIQKPMMVLNDFNESKNLSLIISRLQSGERLALVSDAGTPLISDPGYKLVRECINLGIEVDCLPGPSSVITALTLSGLPPDSFLFVGYPPEKPGHRLKWLQSLNLHPGGGKLNTTLIMFVAPHKLFKTLADLKEIFGDLEVVLANELTKIHQSVSKKLVSEWLENIKNPKGEYTLLFRLND